MRIDLFSIVMATITSSILILIIHFLTKNKQLNKHFGLSSVVLLYICSIVRMVVPIDIYKVSLPIGDPYVYRFLTDKIYSPVFENHFEYENFEFLYIHLFFIILCAVAVVLLIRSALQYIRFVKQIDKYTNLVSKREKQLFTKELNKFGFKRKIRLKVIDENISPMTYGIFSPVVLLPYNDYNDKELSFVFKHELMHQQNHDIILKLLVEIYCCIFWWNPFVYLLKRDLARILELKCDVNSTANCSTNEKIDYLSAILKCIKTTTAKSKEKPKSDLVSSVKSSLVSSDLATVASKNETKERFSYLLEMSTKKHAGKLFTIALSLTCALILALSYAFIILPTDLNPTDTIRNLDEEILAEDGVTFVSNETNTYLVKESDGNYTIYLNNPDFISTYSVPKENVEAGLYECYPIYDSIDEVKKSSK